MIPKGQELLEQALANTLAAQLPATLTQISAAWNDGLPLPAPALVHAGYLTTEREHPTVLVVGTGGEEPRDGGSWAEQVHQLEILVEMASDDERAVQRQLSRYLVAVWEVIKQNQQLDGSVSGLVGVRTLQYGRSRVARGAHGLYVQAGAWQVAATTMESV